MITVHFTKNNYISPINSLGLNFLI
ncbi:conserved hypothetical protein [Xenorhabdus nematophila F1]|uniref:Uncharacterized protein n=1 Tax=Xenorhabdus nematophila (strain ATCC 19061 / DSM 3370 / CCUG 14189 / LMG 1036 / NCIMB 9965 / AN6) TaxID=406817 RepID=D3VBF0_XENNA|nr:hypothetical protein XNC1_1526 [Xenorhabdus nematophila ATCC 19061]CCW29503.1 conserved hypothetical protein [Xenorhabdus nematophila F1]CEK22478.1 hypothetical protein XNC2_1484 [Xenorhabdus nematophila AN6/1]